MFFGDDKKSIMTMISRRGNKGEKMSDATPMKPEIVKMADGTPDGRQTAMEDFMSAHREGSASKMADAMKNFMDIHNSTQHLDTSDAD